MGSGLFRPIGLAIQALILLFTVCLLYFVLVYYPNVMNSVSLTLPFKNIFVDKVVAGAESFPVETKDYKISYESDSSLYYIFVQGKTLDKYVENKLAAQLALKNTIQADSLCDLRIIYTSVDRLSLGQQHTETTGCY